MNLKHLGVVVVLALLASPQQSRTDFLLSELERIVRELRIELTPPSVPTVQVPSGSSVLAAVQALSASGGIVELQAGATYAGPIILPVRPVGAPLITLRTAGTLPDRAVTDADRPVLAHITGNGDGALRIEQTNGYRIEGLSFGRNPNGYGEIIVVENSERVTFDRILIDAREGAKRLIRGNGRHITLTRSWLNGGPWQGQDSQAFVAWEGAGPYTITSNYLAASGENVMFGGADNSSDATTPADILLENNVLHKPQAWKAFPGSVKNIFELKNAKRVTLRNNLLDGVWVDAQAGWAIMLTPGNQDGTAPWSTVEDVLIERNVIVNATAGVMMVGRHYLHVTGQMKRITIKDNVATTDSRFFLAQGEVGGLTIEGNVTDNRYNPGGLYQTDVRQADGTMRTAPLAVDGPFIFRNNTMRDAGYGLHCTSGIGAGCVPMATTFEWSGNSFAAKVYNYPVGTLGITEAELASAKAAKLVALGR